jgi:two-component system KDP operon response regulator KdpE
MVERHSPVYTVLAILNSFLIFAPMLPAALSEVRMSENLSARTPRPTCSWMLYSGVAEGRSVFVKPRPVVVIVDADRGARCLLRRVLEAQSYRVIEADSAGQGLEQAVAWRPDVFILDPDLPDSDGLTLVKRLREWSRAPALVLSARDREADKVAALDAGVNDYLTKPFGTAELLARLRVLQRSAPWITDGPLLIEGDVSVNLATHEVWLKGHRVKFTATEEALFYILVRYVGKVVTCTHLTRCLWGTDAENKIKELRVYIGTLRKQLKKLGEGIWIKTEGSTGYKLQLATISEGEAQREPGRLTTA